LSSPARQAFRLLYAEIFRPRHRRDERTAAFEMLCLAEHNKARLARVRDVAADLLSWFLRPGVLS
jgi:hypothetical protein